MSFDKWVDAPTEAFEFEGQRFKVAYLPGLWQVTTDSVSVENRRLDTALVDALGWSPHSSSTRLAQLEVEVMEWRAQQRPAG